MRKIRSLAQYSGYYWRIFSKMVLFIALPINILIGCLFLYQNQYSLKQLYLEGQSILSSAQARIDYFLLDTQEKNITVSTLQENRTLDAMQEYEFSMDTKEILDILQDYFIALEAQSTFIDEIAVHYIDLSLFVTSSSAWTDTLTNRANAASDSKQEYNRTYLYTYTKEFEQEKGLRGIVHDKSSIFFITGMLWNQKYYGSVTFRCSISALIAEMEQYVNRQKDRLLLVSQDEVIVFDTAMHLNNTPLTDLDPNAAVWLEEDPGKQYVMLDDTQYAVLPSDSTFNGWQYILLYNTQSVMPFIHGNQLIMIAMIIISTLISLGISYYLTIQFYRPMQLLVDVMARPDTPLSKQYESLANRTSELGVALQFLQQSKLQKLIAEHRLLEQQTMLREMEYQALRSEINPHFLYNTLESINWKIRVRLGVNNEPSAMIIDLSKLLRLSFRDKARVIPLRYEIEHAQLYMRLQKIRYKEKFNMEWNIQEDLLDCSVPPWILQPILENAIIHGYVHGQGKCVYISFRCFSVIRDMLYLQVTDTGIGLSREALDDLRSVLSRDDHEQASDIHIGLYNTRKRIKLICGENADLIIDSLCNNSTTITIIIPIG